MNLSKISCLIFVFLICSLSEASAESIVDANNKFAFDLYIKLTEEKQQENIFFSPFSISTALAMTFEDARKETAKQIAKVFYFPEDNKIRREQFLEMINEINKKDKKYQLYTANALWVEKKYKLLDDYLKTIEKYYHGKATNVGFIDAEEREKSRKMINGWIEEKTNHKIKELIKREHLSKDTRLVLTNAIYFKGNWQMQFNKSATKDEEFKITLDKKVKVPMMSLGMREFEFPKFMYTEFMYTETEDLQALELPYEGGELSMLIFLPKKDIKEVEKKLNYNMLKQLKSRMGLRQVEVYLPKFKFEGDYTLNDTLKKMGMPIAFDDNLADFSGMSGKSDLYIGYALHKAFVDVNEEGTEAAAVTVEISAIPLSLAPPPLPVIFRADHPFIFLIQHNKTGAILFIGRVYEPKK